ncbi:MAG: alkaline phosphatase family protein [Pseudonocardiaceae bacterium]
MPTPDHVVIVVMENEDASAVIGARDAPYLNSLAREGALFTNAHAITHPSQPNYLALFSGDTQGVTDDSCPVSISGPNLGRELLDDGRTFTAFSEDLPAAGFPGCTSAGYARKHAPWADFTNLPGSLHQPYRRLGPPYQALPTVAFVVPNLCHDMHDCDVATGDAWLRPNLDGYLAWARSHNSLLIITWDEAEDSASNQIPMMIVGAGVRPGRYDEPVDHYRMLRTIEDMYRLPHAGHSETSIPITDIWTTASSTAGSPR